MKSQFIKSNILVFLITNSANVLAYVFQLYAARLLPVDDYGVFNAINSSSVVLSSFLAVLPLLITKYAIKVNDKVKISALLNASLKFSVYSMLVIGVIFYIFSAQIIEKYTYENYEMFQYFNLILFSGLMLAILYGVLQGLLMYIESSIKNLLLNVVKLLLLVLVANFVIGTYVAPLIAIIGSNILISISIVIYLLRNEHIILKTSIRACINISDLATTFKLAIPIWLSIIATTVITNIDILMVHYFLTEHDTGIYSTISIISKIGLFLTGAFMVVLFPYVSKEFEQGKQTVSYLYTTVFLAFLISISYLGIIYMFPEFIINLLFGEKYVEGSEVLVYATLAMSLFSISQIMINYFMAKEFFGFLPYLFMGILIMFGIVYFHFNDSIIHISYALVIGQIITFLMLVLFMQVKYKKHQPIIKV